MRLSVVIPVLDEEARIVAALDALAPLRAAGHEVIVVDGGSRDRTLEHARTRADRALVAPRGRSVQMNVGACAARGDALLFLHADTRLPVDAADAVARALSGRSRWGRFDVTIDGRTSLLPIVAGAMNLRSRATGIATGDQAIFVARDLFDQVGGYPPIPLMEDIALSTLLRRHGWRPACLPTRVTTSGRRWDERGAWRTVATMWRLRYDYWRGADPRVLAPRYGYATPTRPPTLLVFAKAPVIGRVKTRLAAALGDEGAATLYRELAERTLKTARAARSAGIFDAVELWCDHSGHGHPAMLDWSRRYGVALREQHGDDLGARMQQAMSSVLKGGRAAVLIGTDSPALDVGYLAHAASALQRHDAVVGPAEDGGYVLVGLARELDIFGGVAWSTDAVMVATRAHIAAAQASWAELPMLWDVDRPADVDRYRRTLVRGPEAAASRACAA